MTWFLYTGFLFEPFGQHFGVALPKHQNKIPFRGFYYGAWTQALRQVFVRRRSQISPATPRHRACSLDKAPAFSPVDCDAGHNLSFAANTKIPPL
jgi:hypothetical protein